jgi:hypothetical protein
VGCLTGSSDEFVDAIQGGAARSSYASDPAMILVDSKVLMYAAGAEHPNKRLALAFFRRAAGGRLKLRSTRRFCTRSSLLPRPSSLARWTGRV